MPNKSWALCNLENCGAEDELLAFLGADRINEFIGGDVSATVTAGAEAGGNTIPVTIQMVDANGDNLAAQYSVWAWLSDTAATAVTAVAPSGGTSATTGTILQEHTADVSLDILTDASGVFVLSVVEAGAATWFLNVRLPSGLVVSEEVTFAA